MEEERPPWLGEARVKPGFEEQRYLTSRVGARPPWQPAPPSQLHRNLIRGAVLAALLLLAYVLWSVHTHVRLG